jgi:hypothetical protein
LHYHLEVIIPPTDNVERDLELVLRGFDENLPMSDDDYLPRFWDWYQIGGRYSGSKIEALVGSEAYGAFQQKLIELNVQVKGLQCGKPELADEATIQLVDKLWNEAFPDSLVKQCPLFQHYSSSTLDVCMVGDLPPDLTAFHVIIAPYNKIYESLKPELMWMQSSWNGVSHEDHAWRGSVQEALKAYEQQVSRYKEEVQYEYRVTPDWWCITVDYHS